MVYIKDGKPVENKGWGLFSIPDFFWSIVNNITLFFSTLIGGGTSNSRIKTIAPSSRSSYGNGPSSSSSNKKYLGRVGGVRGINDISDCGAGG